MRSIRRVSFAAAFCAGLAGTTVSHSLADPISYQGRVTDSGASADGSFDINFQVFNAAIGGSPVGPALVRTTILSAEDNGLFAFDDLDFGDDVFTGEDRWIEVSVRPTGGGGFTTLSPRQAVRATPYAQFAQSADVSLDDAYRAGRVIFNDGQDPVIFRGLTQFGQGLQANGFMQFFMSTSSTPILQFGSVPGLGGQTRWFDELGDTIALFQADLEGTGLAMRLFGDGGVMEWDADLGDGGSAGARFFITGPSSGMSFSTGLVGDDSFELPADAISSAEILDEPGLASDTVNSGTTLSSTFQTVMSRTITVPAPGNVVVLANGAISVQRASNANGLLVLGVSDLPNALPDTQQNVLQLPIGGPAGFHNFPASAHGVFEVPFAGEFTFYFNANASGFGQPRIFDPNLTLLYVPSSYGDVTPSLRAPEGGYNLDAPTRGPMTDAEILREQVREQTRAIEELRATQAAMKAQLEKLQGLSEANQAAESSNASHAGD